MKNRMVVFGLFLSLFVSSGALLEAAEISGKVLYQGHVPESKEIDMKIDANCARLQTGPVYEENLLVDSQGGLANVFVYLKSGVKEDGKTAPPAEPVILAQDHCVYRPRVLGLRVGQNLEMVSRDATVHNVRAMPENSQKFNIGMPFEGMKITKKFTEPEIMVMIKCDVHPWMRAYAGVLEHPYFAVTDASGNYTIKDVPSGDYTISFWHETLGELSGLIQVLQNQTYPLDMEYKEKA